MTNAEQAAVRSGQCDFTSVRWKQLRDAVIVERLPAADKPRWQAAYRKLNQARDAMKAAAQELDDIADEIGVADLDVSPWRREVERE